MVLVLFTFSDKFSNKKFSYACYKHLYIGRCNAFGYSSTCGYEICNIDFPKSFLIYKMIMNYINERNISNIWNEKEVKSLEIISIHHEKGIHKWVGSQIR